MRRETVHVYGEGTSKRVQPLITQLKLWAAQGVPWQGVPDTYKADAIRLALVEPAEEGEEEDEPDEDAADTEAEE